MFYRYGNTDTNLVELDLNQIYNIHSSIVLSCPLKTQIIYSIFKDVFSLLTVTRENVMVSFMCHLTSLRNILIAEKTLILGVSVRGYLEEASI